MYTINGYRDLLARNGFEEVSQPIPFTSHGTTEHRHLYFHREHAVLVVFETETEKRPDRTSISGKMFFNFKPENTDEMSHIAPLGKPADKHPAICVCGSGRFANVADEISRLLKKGSFVQPWVEKPVELAGYEIIHRLPLDVRTAIGAE